MRYDNTIYYNGKIKQAITAIKEATSELELIDFTSDYPPSEMSQALMDELALELENFEYARAELQDWINEFLTPEYKEEE